MIDTAKVNPVLTHTADVKNYSFLTVGDDLYLIANTVTGDGEYTEDAVIPKGEYLNGFLVKAWDGQKLVVDARHIPEGFDALNVKDKLEAQEDGTLKKGDTPKGIYFEVTD